MFHIKTAKFVLIIALLMISNSSFAQIKIVIEAESGSYPSPMRLMTGDTAASNSKYLMVPLNNSSNANATISAPVKISKKYYIWARMKNNNRNGAFRVRVDSGSELLTSYSRTSSFVWRKVRELTLSAGTRRIQFNSSTDESALDEILLTDSSSFVPSGKIAQNVIVGSSTPTPTPTPTATPPPTTSRSNFSIIGNRNFSASNLPSDVRIWHTRLINHINNHYTTKEYSPEVWAQKNDTYVLGRRLHQHMSALVIAFRITGDYKILDEAMRLLKITKVNLKDHNGDGYRNWKYFGTDEAGGTFYGKDTHEMDDILAHSMVATVAYALYANRDAKSEYASEANFWKDYLKNDFEAKWRDRKNKATGFPFIVKDLAHAYTAWTKFHRYMGLMFNDSGYKNYADIMARNLANHMRETSSPTGTAYVWDHRILDSPEMCQYSVYSGITMQYLTELHIEGMDDITSTMLNRISNAFGHFTLIPNVVEDFRKTICGDDDRGGLNADTTYGNESRGKLANNGYFFVTAFDRSGKMLSVANKLYELEEGDDSPDLINVAVALMLHAAK